jgi:hypothetical protein
MMYLENQQWIVFEINGKLSIHLPFLYLERNRIINPINGNSDFKSGPVSQFN